MVDLVASLKILRPRTRHSLRILVVLGLLLIAGVVSAFFLTFTPRAKAPVSPPEAKAAAPILGGLTPTEQKQYGADMHWLVSHLKDSGIRAVWPALGNGDCILVTSPHGTTPAEAQGLALRVYVKMSLLRRKDNFSDADFDQCVVLVQDVAGHRMAADRRGKLE